METIDDKTIADILLRAQQIESDHREQMLLYARYREMYLMKNMERPRNSGVDDNDWKLTVDPSSRNEVVGLKRLLDTAELHVEVTEKGEAVEASAKIEAGMRKIVDRSRSSKSRVLSDAILSTVLYGPAILSADSLRDLLSVGNLHPARKYHLEKVQRQTPFLVRVHNPEESYLEHDGDMTTHWHRKFKLRGRDIALRYGEAGLNDNQEYEVRDIFTPAIRLVVVNGKTIFAKEHGLMCIPVASSYSGGTDLFVKPDEQIQSFLYAKAKGELDKWGNSLLTTMRTAIHMRGLGGPMLAVDPEQTPDNIAIDYTGGVRIIRAKAQPVDERIIDPVIVQAKNMLDQISAESTIYRQTLGENINGSTFSGLAMLSNSGKLPMVDMQRALENVFEELFDQILYRIKNEGIDNNLINPNEIPDEYELRVTLKERLPQDNLRNAQIASTLGDTVSNEWKLENVLQVEDSKTMYKQVMKETMRRAVLEALVTNPQVMQNIVAMMTKTPATEQPVPNGTEQPEGMPTPQGTGMENYEQMPQTDAMIPPGEMQ